jgi:hypothetical protein
MSQQFNGQQKQSYMKASGCNCGPQSFMASPQFQQLGYAAPAPGCSLAPPVPHKPACMPAPLHRHPNMGSQYFTLSSAYGM